MPWYFAYGSNMQSGTLRGRRGIEYTRAVASHLVDWKLVLDKPSLLREGNTFANIVRDPGSVVCGVSFEVSDDDLAHIDLTEGVLVGNYQRIEVEVSSLGDETDRFSAYTLTSDRRHPETRPSHRYMSLLIHGAVEHGLPTDYVELLRALPSFDESAAAKEMRATIEAFLRKPTMASGD